MHINSDMAEVSLKDRIKSRKLKQDRTGTESERRGSQGRRQNGKDGETQSSEVADLDIRHSKMHGGLRNAEGALN